MRFLSLTRHVFIGAVVVGTAVLLSGVLFAQETMAAGKNSPEWKAKHELRVKLLKDAAATLQQSRPDLAKALEDMTVPKHREGMQKNE